MILQPYNFDISSYDILRCADKLNVDKYIPVNVVRDIAYCRIYSVLGISVKIERPSIYTSTLIDLMSMVNADAIETSDPVEFAISVIRLISPKVNLRTLERNRELSNNPIVLDFKSNQVNYKDDLSLLNPEYMDLLNIDTKVDLNEIILDQDTLDIIKFYNGMKPVIGELFPVKVIQVNKISKLSDVGKIRKYKFALPYFGVDLVLKKHFIKETKTVLNQNNEVLLMVDVSWSTRNNSKYFSIVRAVILSLLDSFVEGVSKVTILEFHNVVSKEVIINNRNDLKSYVNHKFTSIVGPRGWRNVYNYMKKYAGNSVIFVTDGLEGISNFPSNIKLYGVSTTRNGRLHELCINSGGRFVVV